MCPAAFSKPCIQPGCQELTTRGHYCYAHYKARREAFEQRRGSSTQRGYTYRWQKYSDYYLSQPENALCVRCNAEGRITASECVDHVLPVSPTDPRFWEPLNHQPLCWPCHSRKTIEHDHGFGRAPLQPPFA